MTTSEPKISVWFDHGEVQYLLSEHGLAVHLPTFVVFVVYPAQDSTERARCDNWQKRAARSPLQEHRLQRKKVPLVAQSLAQDAFKILLGSWRIAHPRHAFQPGHVAIWLTSHVKLSHVP